MQTYKILGIDGKEYGPINADDLRAWIAQRRAVATTLAQAGSSADWQPLSSFPEFAEALAGSQSAPGPIGSTSAKAQPTGPVKTSGMAIASLVCGLLGFLCLPGLAGLVLGIVALVKIGRSQGQLRGQGLAIAGICLSGFMVLIGISLGAALVLPALAKAKDRAQHAQSMNLSRSANRGGAGGEFAKAQRIQCVNNLKQIGLAARIYSNDNKETFPPDFLSMSNELNTPRILVCPADAEHTKVSTWADFDPRNNATYEFLKPGITEKEAVGEVIFRCPVHNTVGMGDGSVQTRPSR